MPKQIKPPELKVTHPTMKKNLHFIILVTDGNTFFLRGKLKKYFALDIGNEIPSEKILKAYMRLVKSEVETQFLTSKKS